MVVIMYTESSAAQMTCYSQCWNENYIPEQISQLCQWWRSFLREWSANRQLSSLLRMIINHQFSCWSHSKCQSNWHNSLPVNLARLQTVSRSSLKCSHFNLNLNHFLMNSFMKPIWRTKMISVMKLKKFWKSSRNKSKVLSKSLSNLAKILLMILAVLIHLAVLMNLIIDSVKSVLNVTVIIMRWILTLTLTLTFH